MKSINKDLLKSIGIGILIIIAIILLIIVISYNKISIGKVIPRAEQYELSNEMQEELESERADENSEIIITYELDATDLKQFEKTKEYNKGKKDPFAEETVSSTKNSNNTTGNNSIDNGSSNNSSSQNFYDDDGTK